MPRPDQRRARRGRRGRRAADRREGGFTLVEQLVAITLLVGVLMTLLGAVGSGTIGIVAGRQRTIATSLAKQAVERLQGAGYAKVLMNLSSTGLSTDSRVTGTAPALYFEGEPLVGGGSDQYRTTMVQSGTTFTISTYITSVTLSNAQPYRRVTVVAEWTPSTTGNLRSERFSSLVYPLDYGTYPASSGSAEATGGLATVVGTLEIDTFEEVQLTLPGARATTSASTLRTAQGTGSGASAFVDVAMGPLTSTQCGAGGVAAVQCPLGMLDRFGDNDVITTAPTWTGGSPSLYTAATVSTPGGALFSTPAGSNDSHAAVATCSGCGFGDNDGVPWADASSSTSAATSSTFNVPGGSGLTGSLWQVGSGWAAGASIDHDTPNSGTATATAQLSAPEVKVLTVKDVLEDGAVKVKAFTATATAPAGGTSGSVTASAPAVEVKMRDGTGYRTVSVTPGTATDVTTNGTVTRGGATVAMTSRVQSQPSTTSSSGSAPRTAAAAQLPSLLVVTVTATVTGTATGSFTTTFDYGLVAARSRWQVSA